jgi:O-antigen/teichoic acid export membrane protein
VCFLSGLGLHTTVLAFALLHGFGLVGAACAAVSGHLVSGTLAARFLRRELAHVHDRGRSAPVTWRELLQFGGAVQGTGAAAIAQVQAGKVLLGASATSPG